jgi:hypothetical protein
VNPEDVVCKPFWTGEDGKGVMGLFLTEKTPSDPSLIAGGSKLRDGADLELSCQVGTE